jgi:hypothetical protein
VSPRVSQTAVAPAFDFEMSDAGRLTSFMPRHP